MSSDDDYANFLDKANQDTGSKPSKKDSNFAQTKAVDTEVPGPLKSLDAFYTSDSDEPFEPVALGHEGKELDESEQALFLGGLDVQKLTWRRDVWQIDRSLGRSRGDGPQVMEC